MKWLQLMAALYSNSASRRLIVLFEVINWWKNSRKVVNMWLWLCVCPRVQSVLIILYFVESLWVGISCRDENHFLGWIEIQMKKYINKNICSYISPLKNNIKCKSFLIFVLISTLKLVYYSNLANDELIVDILPHPWIVASLTGCFQ